MSSALVLDSSSSSSSSSDNSGGSSSSSSSDSSSSSGSGSASSSNTNNVQATTASSGFLADFASDFGVTIDIPQPSADVTGSTTTPATKRSTSQMSNHESQASPEGPENKRVRSALEYTARAPAFSPSQASPPDLRGYKNRKNTGEVVKKMGLRAAPTKLPTSSARIFSKPKVLQNVPSEGFHYMHTPLEFRANGLDMHTQYLTEALLKKYALPEADPIGPTSQDTQVHVGRICSEDDPDGALKAKSVMLEGSLGLSNGRRIRLDLSRLAQYSLFPGQIVAVEGVNAGDGAFVVRKLYEGAPAPLPTHTTAELLEFKTANEGQPTVIWAAAGPFTTVDNMNYEPLADLFQSLVKAPVKPDVLVLMGPFVSVDHPVVKTGHITEAAGDDGNEEVTLTFEECFRLYVAEPILGFVLDNPEIKTTMVLAPSLQDAHHTFCFPQPAFAKELFRYDDGETDLVNDGRVVLLSNPATFKVNDVTVTLSTTDVVSDVAKKQMTKSGEHKVHRLQLAAQHVVAQRHSYPLFPAARSRNGDSVPLDLARLSAARFPANGAFSPDILLVPSKKLNHFIYNTCGILCVNGGTLAKMSSGGTYTRISVFPPDKLDLSVKAPQTNEIVNRSAIEIVKI